MATSLFVKFRAPGWHHWPGAPPNLEYLGRRHRHLFHIMVEIHGVPTDGQRSLEFHTLLDHCKLVWRDIAKRGSTTDYGTMSCEEMADAMMQRLSRSNGAVVSVTVSEDGECGARVQGQVPVDS